MKNQQFSGTPTGHRFALCPTTVLAGDPVLLGGIPAVANTSYNSTTGGADFYYNGSFRLTVIAKSQLSPAINAGIKPGDKLYYDGGTLDSTTNVTTGGSIDVNTGGTLFGNLDPIELAITSGTTNTSAGVKIGG